MKKKKYLYLISSFIVPIIILLVNFIILQIKYPNQNVFSSNQILVADLKSQYVSLFNYFRNVLQGRESIFYSFSSTLGGNMFGTFTYYLSSPLNLILIFSSKYNITFFIRLLIFLKIGLCGLTMYIYLNHKRKNKELFSLIFSIYYSLMAFNISYYFNVMWLDVVYLTPIVIYGLDELIHQNKKKLYIISLILAIISNFYIAYMLCIFIVIYFIYEIIITYNKKDKRIIIINIKQFVLCSVISVLVCSIIIIPTLYNLQNIIRSPINSSMYIQRNFFTNFLISLSKLYMLPQCPNNLLSKYTPNVYFGILPLLFSIIFFYGKISYKEKYLTIIIMIFFFLSFSTNSLSLLWHGFTFPNGYAYRFSFLFSFFMILMSFKSITSNDTIKIHKLLTYLFIVLFIGLVQINDRSNICFNYVNIILTILFIIIYYILTKFSKRLVCKIILCIIVLIEVVIQVNNSFYITANLEYETDYKYYLDTICSVSKKYQDNNYRFDSPLIFGALESYSCGDYRIAGATTINNKNVYQFLYRNGFNVTYSTVVNNDNNNIIYSLFGINYYLDSHKENSLKKISYNYGDNSVTKYYLHSNPYALPIGFVINNKYDILYDTFSKTNPFEYQNSLLKSMSGLNKDVLVSYEIKKIDQEHYEVFIDNSKEIFIYLSYPIPENDVYFAEIKIDDQIYDIDSDNTGVFRIENKYEGKTIEIDLTLNEEQYHDFEPVLSVYSLNEDIFKEHIEILKENTLNVIKKSKNYLKGKISVNSSSILFLSIPYEKGWNIYVDGKKVSYFKLYDAFIGINLKDGKHIIEMKYYSPGFNLGLILSIIGILLYWFYIKKNN